MRNRSPKSVKHPRFFSLKIRPVHNLQRSRAFVLIRKFVLV